MCIIKTGIILSSTRRSFGHCFPKYLSIFECIPSIQCFFLLLLLLFCLCFLLVSKRRCSSARCFSNYVTGTMVADLIVQHHRYRNPSRDNVISSFCVFVAYLTTLFSDSRLYRVE
jgi:hypothetical protein